MHRRASWHIVSVNADEVPKELQSTVTFAYASYLGLCLCLIYQLAAVIVALALINGKSGRLSGFFLACASPHPENRTLKSFDRASVPHARCSCG